MTKICVTLWMWVLVVGCAASLNEQPGIDFGSPSDAAKKKLTSSQFKAYPLRLKVGKKRVDSVAYSCQAGSGSDTVLLINSDNAAFDKDFCSYGASQAFLSHGFQVVGINRLGYGAKGARDFSGPNTQVAIVAAAKAVAKKFKPAKNIVGIWSDGSGSIAAGFAAKKIPSLKWWVSGNGIYDMEELNASLKDKSLKQKIAGAKKSEDESDFYEARSLGWDTSDLPKIIVLYHGKENKAVSSKQSSSFRDTLAAEEFKVHFEPEIAGVGAVVNSYQVRIILKRLIPIVLAKANKKSAGI